MDPAVCAILAWSPLMWDLIHLLEHWDLPLLPLWSARAIQLYQHFQTRTFCQRVNFYHSCEIDGEYCLNCIPVNPDSNYLTYDCHILRGLNLPNIYACRNCHKLLTIVTTAKCEECMETFHRYLVAERQIRYPGDQLKE